MGHALIVGAGIGGLCAALTLHRIGWRATVCEAVDPIRPLGVGINLLPHGAAVLHGLGLGPALDATGVRTRAVEYRTRYGHLITADPRGIEAGFDHPQYSIHRGRLQFLLLDAATERLGPGAVRTGLRLESFAQDGFAQDGGVAARLRRADGGAETLEADILIGADGFNSAVRAQLHPAEGPAHSEGVMMWRGAREQAPFGDGRTMFIAGDHDVKFVCYPIAADLGRGTALINWVAELRHDDPRPAAEADWTRQGTRDFIDAFRGFVLPDIDIVALMEGTERILEYPMIDRDPLPWWTDRRVTLLGDAAHPMYPIGANGASQAILDAAALAAALEGALEGAGPDAALAAYEAARRPATAEVVAANRRAGPEKVLDIAAARLTGPGDRIADLIAAEEIEAVARDYRRVAGFRRRTD